MKNCSICNSVKEEFIFWIPSSCQHITCSGCLHNIVIANKDKLLSSIYKEELVEMKCFTCDEGKMRLNNCEIYEILKIKNNFIEESKFCGECKIGIVSCFDNYGESRGKMNNKLKFFCKNCRKFICLSCLATHSSDHLITNEFNNPKKINELNLNLPFSKFEDFEEYLNEQHSKISAKVKNESEFQINCYEKLISKIQDVIFSIKNNTSEYNENLEFFFKIIKLSYKNYLIDLQNSKIDKNSNLNTHSDSSSNSNELDKQRMEKYELEAKNFESFIFNNPIDSFIKSLSSLNSQFKKFENQIFHHLDLLNNENLIDENNINFKKCSSYQFDEYVRAILELKDGSIACWTEEGIHLLKLKNPNNEKFELEVIKTFPSKLSNDWYMPTFPVYHNDNIIYTDGLKELRIFDKNFKIIQTFEEPDIILPICTISSSCFAVGLFNGNIKIYSLNVTTKKYELQKVYKYLESIECLCYVPKYDLLVCGLYNRTIAVIKLSLGKTINILTDLNSHLTSLILMNDNLLASGSYDGIIKFWSIKENHIPNTNNISIECIKTIKAHENNNLLFLNLLENGIIVSNLFLNYEIKIWDVKTYECIKTYKENSSIIRLQISKNNGDNNRFFITRTSDRKVNLWKM